MKRIFVLLVICSLIAGTADAQIRFGIKGGVNFANFKYDGISSVSFDNATGWQAGVMAQFTLPIVQLGIQPELLYTVKKSKIDDDTNSIGYFEIPVNLRWAIGLKFFRPYLLAGPYFGYAVNFSGDSFNKDNISRTDWGIGVGGGVELWKLQLGLRYSWGLQNVAKDSGDDKLKNNVFSITAGLFF